MSIVAFARTFGITERKFYYWVKKELEAGMSGDDNAGFIEIGQLVKPGPLVNPAPLGEVEIQDECRKHKMQSKSQLIVPRR